MADSAQLARIAAARPPEPEQAVKIYKLRYGVDVWMWLCQACLKKRLAKRWNVVETRRHPFEGTCDDCRWNATHPAPPEHP